MTTPERIAAADRNPQTPGPSPAYMGEVGAIHDLDEAEERAFALHAVAWAFRDHDCIVQWLGDRRPADLPCATPGHDECVAVARDLLAMVLAPMRPATRHY